MHSPDKSCELDPAPTWLLKKCIKDLLPIITTIINTSMHSGHVPDMFKCAHIRPLLKKSGLDVDILKNYRPVSNLSFISKILEKVIDKRIDQHLQKNCLHEKYQSAYRRFHSTETALLKVQSDILETLDKGATTVLIMLDLSAAFDTIDHKVLLQRFERMYGITGCALQWVSSYLHNRSQVVVIENELSDPVTLKFGVPQGSVLGPKFYTMYTRPLGDLICKYGLKYHFYADDTQLYVSFNTRDNTAELEALRCVETCLKDIENWMHQNMLKLNTDKTEVMLFTSRHNLKNLSSLTVSVGDCAINPATSVRNLGVTFDQVMDLQQHVNGICRSAYAQLRNIGQIRCYLTNNATRSLISGLVTSRLDYCNGLLYGLPKATINKMQRVQNAAARVMTRTSKYDHISPVLKELHWLPIEYRIKFKILTLTYKALNGQSPVYIKDTINIYNPGRSLRSMDSISLVVPKTKSVNYGNRQFKAAAACLWNQLPTDIRNARTLLTFRKALKTHFFRIAFT
jgi:hypothetical protein